MNVFHALQSFIFQRAEFNWANIAGWWDNCGNVFFLKVSSSTQDNARDEGSFVIFFCEKKCGRQTSRKVSLFPRKTSTKKHRPSIFLSQLNSAEVWHVFIYPVSVTDRLQNHLDCTIEELVPPQPAQKKKKTRLIHSQQCFEWILENKSSIITAITAMFCCRLSAFTFIKNHLNIH